ncbi:MAG TPA: M23 family metallopeptidase [Steroidobacteraceae bacterium]|nr:M23 family metallopeptidase [Steroidobacteraceae bacterium]
MNVIFLSRRKGKARQLNLVHPLTLSLIAGLTLAILGSAFALGLQFGRGTLQRGVLSDTLSFGSLLAEQKRQITDLKQQLQLRVDAMAMRLGAVNAHVIRLDALGKRLTEMADIDSHEFNFDLQPPSGGPEEDGEGVSAQIPDLTAMLTQLEQRVNLRDSQLLALENVILARELKEEIHPAGRPVTRGFISSYFGERADPFDGREAFHKGVDFAGTVGDKVVAVAAGVVTWAGERSGFGRLVEINHGDGFVTRYAHNQRTLVSVGTTVKRGEAVALMGSTGRSTGPHVHFEVLRNGRQVNPLSFVGR